MGACCTNRPINPVEEGLNTHVGPNKKKRNDLDKAMNLLFKRNSSSMTLSLRFTARELPTMDSGSKTDSFAVIYQSNTDPEQGEVGKWVEVGRTEVIMNTNEPEFIKTVQVEYHFQEDQELMVALYDSDKFNDEEISLEDSEYIGQAEFRLQTLVSNADREIEFPLFSKKSSQEGGKEGEGEGEEEKHAEEETKEEDQTAKGFVKVHFEEDLSCTNQDLKLVISLHEGNFAEDKAYFIEIEKVNPDSAEKTVSIFKTEKVTFHSESLTQFKDINIPLDCFLFIKNTVINEKEIPLKLVVKQYIPSGEHQKIGEISTTIGDLLEGDSEIKLEVKESENTFSLKIEESELTKVNSFLDYITNGCQMALVAGISFGASNKTGGPDGKNLHSTELKDNYYFIATQQIGNILLNFDSDKQVPLYGFGAIIDERYYKTNVSNCFALNGNSFRPEVFNVAGIQAYYINAINNIELGEATLLAPMLQRWNEMVSFEVENNIRKYYTFLILTDGAIQDKDETIEQIVASTKLPVSVIIVGIGNGDFSDMEFLDSDGSPLFCQKTQTFAKRDNVQFVKYSDNKGDTQKLASETLQELPRQMLEYFEGKEIEPKDMKLNSQNNEVKDYSSHKAMQLISNEFFKTQVNSDKRQEILTQGIADPDTIDYESLVDGYQNKLKI
ncbi:unnamed protein product [Moneuplotes crassus]|uniref:C2 domain-containing protein n=1 Tax=Euplotes crassus TaxID=5936 RepID=A0AAD1U5F9_EUPCR|nr:unnamed protein product [Moneuplotes crassus]